MMPVRFVAPPLPAPVIERAGRISAMILLRLALALAISFTLLAAALAGDRPILKGDIVTKADALTLGDLVEGVPAAVAGKLLFRAPALGETGTIQVRRILDAAADLGVIAIDTQARQQIVVTRAARRIGASEIETAVKQALGAQHGLDARALSITFDGTAPSLSLAPGYQGQPVVEDLAYDRRSHRVTALVSAGDTSGGRKVSVRIAGVALETLDVAVLTRPLNRGETAQAGDFLIEKRLKSSLPADAQPDTDGLPGRVARRQLQAGAVVRSGDLARPEVVTRGDVVTIVYEVPGMTLTLRGRASDSGALGDTIAVVNPQSKKTLQAQIVATGKVSVSAPLPGPIAANMSPAQP